MNSSSDSQGFDARAVLRALERANRKIQRLENQLHEPVAIVGSACRLPGQIRSAPQFWEALVQGKSTIGGVTRFPLDRKDIYTRTASMFEEVQAFDHKFFELSKAEARLMDPQHKMMLEVGYEALEDANATLERVDGSRMGVYSGVNSQDFVVSSTFDDVRAYSGTGSLSAFAGGRLAYLFNWRGPNISVDTQCSSSLVALHLALRALRSRECDQALVAGASLLSGPIYFSLLCSMGALSRTGRCATFDDAADGYVRGEAVVALVLKRLSDALADSDEILAVIRGSAVNYDGRSNGLTAPNPAAQADCVSRALRDACVQPEDLGYFEAHGTGTPIGDPIELRGLLEVFSSREEHLVVGSAKPNFGHCEFSAGLVGLLKAALVVRTKTIPPNLNFKTPNSRFSWGSSPFKVPTELLTCSDLDGVSFAGVSSFGASGTNAHAILSSPPEPKLSGAEKKSSTYSLVLSAKSSESLADLASSHVELLRTTKVEDLDAYCRTSLQGRSLFSCRALFVERSQDKLEESLRDFAVKRDCTTTSGSPPRVGWIFSGHGGQWEGLCRSLYEENEVFRRAFTQIAQDVASESGWSPLSYLKSGKGFGSKTEILIYTHQLSIGACLNHYGLAPDVVVGHSLGEVAAAVLSGRISRQEGARIVTWRNRLAKRIMGRGSMAFIELPVDEVRENLLEYEGGIEIAGINGPSETVVSGDLASIAGLQATLECQGVFVRNVMINFASHSRQIEQFSAELVSALSSIAPKSGHTPMFSTADGTWVTDHKLDAHYWFRNWRRPILFQSAIEQLNIGGVQKFVEIGGHPVLTRSIRSSLGPGAPHSVFNVSRRGTNENVSLLKCVGNLLVHGASVSKSAVHGPGPLTKLPPYPWSYSHSLEETVAKQKGIVQETPKPDTWRHAETKDLVERLRHILCHAMEEPLHAIGSEWILSADSLIIQDVRARIEKSSGVLVPASFFIGGKSVQQLAADLQKFFRDGPRNATSSRWSKWVPTLRDEELSSSSDVLLCFHHAGGSSLFFNSWPRRLGPARVCPVELPGHLGREDEPFLRSVDAIARAVSTSMADNVQSRVVLFGHSFGALIALELAKLLESAGKPPVALCLSAAPNDSCKASGTLDFEQLSDDDLLSQVALLGGVSPGTDVQTLAPFLPQIRADFSAAERYNADFAGRAPFDIKTPVALLHGLQDPICDRRVVDRWLESFPRRPRQLAFEGDHFFLVQRQSQVLAAMEAFLEEVTTCVV